MREPTRTFSAIPTRTQRWEFEYLGEDPAPWIVDRYTPKAITPASSLRRLTPEEAAAFHKDLDRYFQTYFPRTAP